MMVLYSYASGEKLYESAGGAAVPVDSYEYLMLDMDKTGYGMDDDKTVGTELFSRIGTDRYIKTTGDNGETIYLRNNLNETDYESLYKLGNLKINPEAAQNVGKIPLSTVQGKEDFDRAKELVDIWDEKFASLTRTCMRSRITCHSTIIILVNMPLWVRHFIIM